MIKPFGEIVESSLTHWVIQSWQWDSFPSFGSLLTIQNDTIMLIGVVYAIQTGSIDPSRFIFAYKKTEQELQQEQPQIFEFLATRISCLPLAYQEHARLDYALPPKPPKIHSFVHEGSPLLYRQFFENPHFINLLFRVCPSSNLFDDLLWAMLHRQAQHEKLSLEKLQNLANQFSLVTADYRRLKIFLQQTQSLLGPSNDL